MLEHYVKITTFIVKFRADVKSSGGMVDVDSQPIQLQGLSSFLIGQLLLLVRHHDEKLYQNNDLVFQITRNFVIIFRNNEKLS